jgi:hypothetical protein
MKLTKEQGIILTGFTGLMMCKFSDFHKDVEKRLGYPVFTHQFASETFSEEIKELYRDDFVAMMSCED